VLLAEMLLRCTQARQIVSVYLQIYLDAFSLHQGDEKELAALLSLSLGLAWRPILSPVWANEMVSRYHGYAPEDRGTDGTCGS